MNPADLLDAVFVATGKRGQQLQLKSTDLR